MDRVHLASCISAGVGAAIAIIPAATTALIVCSKAIFINVIANVAVAILTLGHFTIGISGIGLVPLPFIFWQISLGFAVAGLAVVGLSLTVMAANKIFEHFKPKPKHAFA